MLSIVLVAPKEPGNIGSAARAMKNMGFDRLCLVAPRCDLQKARPLASHAVDLIDNALIFDDLLTAIGNCELVASTTARERRDHAKSLTPRQAAPQFSAKESAIVFGREESGLTNEELDLCHIHLTIPTSDVYQSLNLAQAVLIICYELFLADKQNNIETKDLAKRNELEGMYEHLLHFMLQTGYTDQQRKMHILRRFRQIFDRAELDSGEIKLIRGLIAQGLWATKKSRDQETYWPRDEKL